MYQLIFYLFILLNYYYYLSKVVLSYTYLDKYLVAFGQNCWLPHKIIQPRCISTYQYCSDLWVLSKLLSYYDFCLNNQVPSDGVYVWLLVVIDWVNSGQRIVCRSVRQLQPFVHLWRHTPITLRILPAIL